MEELLTSLGRICVGAGLVMKFGAFSEPDVRILDDDDVEKQEIFIGGLPQDVSQDDIHPQVFREIRRHRKCQVEDAFNDRKVTGLRLSSLQEQGVD